MPSAFVDFADKLVIMIVIFLYQSKCGLCLRGNTHESAQSPQKEGIKARATCVALRAGESNLNIEFSDILCGYCTQLNLFH